MATLVSDLFGLGVVGLVLACAVGLSGMLRKLLR